MCWIGSLARRALGGWLTVEFEGVRAHESGMTCDQSHLAQLPADHTECDRRYVSMGRLGSTTSRRARQMRRVLARWQRSGLTLREFGQQHGIPLSTLMFRGAIYRKRRQVTGRYLQIEGYVLRPQ
jgi:hypothetical protein